ncbi:FliM/FliN family flagellar motor switch protein [Rouxiella sp. T17]|uniref:FliM/FliN family flagellar motor switch protein n=1 Tax=Rouxiella sp. T17 TaxID=3085684 RepID=UPI002FCBDDAA
MINHKLRNLDKKEINEIITREYWCSVDRDNDQTVPLDLTNLIEFKTYEGWIGIINLYSWFQYFFMHQRGMSFESWNKDELIELFLNTYIPIDIVYSEYTYTQIVEAFPVSVTTEYLYSLLSFSSKQGKVWISSLPKLDSKSLSAKLSNQLIKRFKLNVYFLLGESTISTKLLSRLKLGDALLVSFQCEYIMLENNILGKYSIKDENVIFENNEDLTHKDFSDNEYIDRLQERLGVLPLDDLPISLTYILQQSKLTIGELQDLFRGKVLPCEEDNYKKIIIQANGINLAQGELIWLEDKPAILINSLEDGNATK